MILLIDLPIAVLAYTGVRLYESARKPKPRHQRHADRAGVSAVKPNGRGAMTASSADAEPASDPQAAQRHQLRRMNRMSAVTIGTGALRLLIPTPAFVLLNIAAYTYTMLPFYRQVEDAVTRRLLKEGKLDGWLLMGLGNLLLLGTNRYLTADIGLALGHAFRTIQHKARGKAERRLGEHLSEGLLDPAQRVWAERDGVEIEIALAEVQPGDVLVVRAGETIAVDGQVVDGMASVDQHAFTGESYPVEKGVDERVFASTLMLTGRLKVRVEQSGRDTAIARIGAILEQSSVAKTTVQLRAEQWAERANLPFLALAGVGFLVSGPVGAMVILGGNTVQAMQLLGPLATINYQSAAARRQLLIKQGQSLEGIGAVDTMLFDKTGTLTDGELQISRIHVLDSGHAEDEVLYCAALAEHQLSHPIARAIMRRAEAAGIAVAGLADIEYRLGFGVVVQDGDRAIHVGSARFMAAEGLPVPIAARRLQATIHASGHSLVMVAIAGRVAGLIELEATLRPEVQTVFAQLRCSGIHHIGIVSGDHAAPTRRLAAALGADSWYAGVLPEEKADIVRRCREQGRTVCFVGDGVNDAIAMQQADVSISLRGATTLATDVADIVLLDPDLSRLCDLLTLSRRLEANQKRGLRICFTGMGTVVAGSFLLHIDVLVALGVHFVLGSSAIANAMLPLLERGRERRISGPTVSVSEGEQIEPRGAVGVPTAGAERLAAVDGAASSTAPCAQGRVV